MRYRENVPHDRDFIDQIPCLNWRACVGYESITQIHVKKGVYFNLCGNPRQLMPIAEWENTAIGETQNNKFLSPGNR